MNLKPASSKALRFAADSIPASATTTMSVTPCRFWNASKTGMRVWVSALLPANVWTSSGNPEGVDQQPDLDLRVDPAFLAHPDLAQLILGSRTRSTAW